MPGEKFNVRLAPEDGGPSEAVVAEVGLEGFNLLSLSGRVLRKYPLHHISRWSMRGSSLILFAKSPVRAGSTGAQASAVLPGSPVAHDRQRAPLSAGGCGGQDDRAVGR